MQCTLVSCARGVRIPFFGRHVKYIVMHIFVAMPISLARSSTLQIISLFLSAPCRVERGLGVSLCASVLSPPFFPSCNVQREWRLPCVMSFSLSTKKEHSRAVQGHVCRCPCSPNHLLRSAKGPRDAAEWTCGWNFHWWWSPVFRMGWTFFLGGEYIPGSTFPCLPGPVDPF